MQDLKRNRTSEGKTYRQGLWQLLVFPCFLLWCEALLRVFSGVGLTMSPVPAALAAAGTGALVSLFLWLVGQASQRAAWIAGILLSILTGLHFAAASVLRTVFATYMTPGNMVVGAGNVIRNYGDEFRRGLLAGTFRFVLFLFPCIAAVSLLLKQARGTSGTSAPGNPELAPALLLAAGILLTGGSAAAAASGANARLYGAQYSYHSAVEAFGLLTATRLDLQYKLFGNPAAGFGPGGTALADPAAGPAESGATESDAAALSATASDASASDALPVVYGENVMDLDFTAEALNRTKQTQQLSSYLQTLTPSKKNPYTGLFAGKNLILVCAEAYCDRFIRPELTPTLWRLTHNGIFFEEYYQCEWGGSTTTGELAFLEGLCGSDGDDSLSGIADNNHYFTMGNQLQRLGYSSIAFHTGSHKYYQRHTTHENLGYNQFAASGNGLQRLMGRSYAPDTDLIDKTTPLYVGHQPFSVYYMTISGHAPYEKNSPYVWEYYDRVNEIVGTEYQEKTKYYICYQMELEEAMKLLVERIEEAGIADDTVIVLTGDHYPYGLGGGRTWHNDRDYIKDLLHGSDFFRWEQDRSGLIIWSGCLEHENADMACTVSAPVGNLDILPTLSNLFGLEYDSRLLPGRDVFAPNQRPLVFWNNLSIVTTEGKFDGRKDEWHPDPGYEWTAEDPEFLERLHHMVNDRMLMARLIMQTDYYGLLFGEDDVVTAGDILWDPQTIGENKEKAAER